MEKRLMNILYILTILTLLVTFTTVFGVLGDQQYLFNIIVFFVIIALGIYAVIAGKLIRRK